MTEYSKNGLGKSSFCSSIPFCSSPARWKSAFWLCILINVKTSIALGGRTWQEQQSLGIVSVRKERGSFGISTRRQYECTSSSLAFIPSLTRAPVHFSQSKRILGTGRIELPIDEQSCLITLRSTSIVDDDIKVATNFPRSKYWVNDKAFRQKEIVQLEKNMMDSNVIQSLVSSSSSSSSSLKEANVESSCDLAPAVTTIHRNKSGNIIAVEIASALSTKHVAKIRALSGSIQNSIDGLSQNNNNLILGKLLKEHYEHRSFGEGKGGNDCTYLAPFLQALCPSVAKTVIAVATLAWEAAWNDSINDNDEQNLQSHPKPASLGIRTSEHLSYNGWRSLEAHKDEGSVYTIMISIKDPKEYEGGEFFIQNSMMKSTDIKLDQFSAIVFKSDTVHGVRPITSGHRESFVTELWWNEDSPIGTCRPTEEQWEKFVATVV